MDSNSIWRRFKSWLERTEHADFFFNQFAGGGLVSFLVGKALPVMGTITPAFFAWIGNEPSYIVVLSCMGGLVLSLASAYLILIIGEKIYKPEGRAPKVAKPSRIRAQTGRGMHGNQNANNNSEMHLITKLVFVALVAAVVIITCNAAIQNFQITASEESKTKLLINPTGRVHFKSESFSYPFGFDVVLTNSGPRSVDNMVGRYKLIYSDHIMSLSEEVANIQSLEPFFKNFQQGDNLLSEQPTWYTMTTNEISKEQWDSATNGLGVIYIFSRYKYEVNKNKKITDFCSYIGKDYPSIHKCGADLNKIYNEKN